MSRATGSPVRVAGEGRVSLFGQEGDGKAPLTIILRIAALSLCVPAIVFLPTIVRWVLR